MLKVIDSVVVNLVLIWASVAVLSFVLIVVVQLIMAAFGKYSYFNHYLIHGSPSEVLSTLTFLAWLCLFWFVTFPPIIVEIVRGEGPEDDGEQF